VNGDVPDIGWRMMERRGGWEFNSPSMQLYIRNVLDTLLVACTGMAGADSSATRELLMQLHQSLARLTADVAPGSSAAAAAAVAVEPLAVAAAASAAAGAGDDGGAAAAAGPGDGAGAAGQAAMGGSLGSRFGVDLSAFDGYNVVDLATLPGVPQAWASRAQLVLKVIQTAMPQGRVMSISEAAAEMTAGFKNAQVAASNLFRTVCPVEILKGSAVRFALTGQLAGVQVRLRQLHSEWNLTWPQVALQLSKLQSGGHEVVVNELAYWVSLYANISTSARAAALSMSRKCGTWAAAVAMLGKQPAGSSPTLGVAADAAGVSLGEGDAAASGSSIGGVAAAIGSSIGGVQGSTASVAPALLAEQWRCSASSFDDVMLLDGGSAAQQVMRKAVRATCKGKGGSVARACAGAHFPLHNQMVIEGQGEHERALLIDRMAKAPSYLAALLAESYADAIRQQPGLSIITLVHAHAASYEEGLRTSAEAAAAAAAAADAGRPADEAAAAAAAAAGGAGEGYGAIAAVASGGAGSGSASDVAAASAVAAAVMQQPRKPLQPSAARMSVGAPPFVGVPKGARGKMAGKTADEAACRVDLLAMAEGCMPVYFSLAHIFPDVRHQQLFEGNAKLWEQKLKAALACDEVAGIVVRSELHQHAVDNQQLRKPWEAEGAAAVAGGGLSAAAADFLQFLIQPDAHKKRPTSSTAWRCDTLWQRYK
jgi:hypothetical protein